jgi:hypothetical protein
MSAGHRSVRPYRPAGQAARAALVVVIGAAAALGIASPGARASGSPSPGATQPAGPAPDLAEGNPVDPDGNAINLHQTAAQANNSMNCTLQVPASPLTAQGLATPWKLGDGCSEANPDLQAFVEATILAPSGYAFVYDPLVVSWSVGPAVTPKPPVIPAGSEVIIDTGFNGSNLVLEGPGAYQGKCIDAYGNSIIAQTAACNAQAFYADANHLISTGKLKVPALGTGSDGKPCETTRSFSLIDQDQSDNVLTGYLLTSGGKTALDSTANTKNKALRGATVITNGSDDALIGKFVDPALGCKPFAVFDPTTPQGHLDSQALNELDARQDQRGTIALLPVNDPQLLLNGGFSIGKVNAYRGLTDQPPLSSSANATQNAFEYCLDMVNIAPAKLQLDLSRETGVSSPVPAQGDNLATFMGSRLSASFMNLKCSDFGLKNPVRLTLNAAGVATAVSYNTTPQQGHP